jgi:hypothetical protein
MLTGNPASGEPGAIPVPARSASLALDIGPGRGALIIYPSERFRGREIEISRRDVDTRPGDAHRDGDNHTEGGGRRVHTGVHERRSRTGPLLTAVFGSLEAGEYAVWADGQTTAGTVSVPEESVAEFQLP